jgi:hypothetical protein
MAFSMTYMTIGLLLVIFSHDLARGLNRASVKFYELPMLKKKIPLSRLAGSEFNYKTSLYFFRVFGAFMALAGTIFLGLTLLWPRLWHLSILSVPTSQSRPW